MKKLVAFLMVVSMLSGCVTKVPLNGTSLPSVTNGKQGVSLINKYVMYDYDAQNNSITITDISGKQPHSDSLKAMYDYNWNMHKHNSNAIASDCVYIVENSVFKKCTTDISGIYDGLSVYHDSIYRIAFGVGLICPIPLVWPLMAIIMPNTAARSISDERVNTVGKFIYQGVRNVN